MFLFSPLWSGKNKKKLELHKDKAPVCCNGFGDSSLEDQSGLFLFWIG